MVVQKRRIDISS